MNCDYGISKFFVLFKGSVNEIVVSNLCGWILIWVSCCLCSFVRFVDVSVVLSYLLEICNGNNYFL